MKIFIKFCSFVLLIIMVAPQYHSQLKEDLDKCSKKNDSLLRINFQKSQQIDKLNSDIKRLNTFISNSKSGQNKLNLLEEMEKKLTKCTEESAQLKQEIERLNGLLKTTSKNNLTASSKSSKTNFTTIKIGNQTWMSENLNVTKFRNGDIILEAQTDELWIKAAEQKVAAWCYYDNDPTQTKLYNWYAVNDPRGLAPEGYHVPDEDDWNTLVNHLGGETVAAPKLKFASSWGDSTSVVYAKNNFAAEPMGWRKSSKEGIAFTKEGAFFWCSTALSLKYAWTRYLIYKSNDVKSYCYPKSSGLSVRCVKNK
ncbi:MAG: hypothetical protein EB100_01915 [Crocinitomicaceae bacterium]|nr:hypothetical protein [Crocinitomicaceae bacterium]